MEKRERLEKVELQADVYMACVQHALSTENYEVMGMLIGTVSEIETIFYNGKLIINAFSNVGSFTIFKGADLI